MKTAAIYARVSSDRQKEDQTIGSQIAALVDYASGQGYMIPSDCIFKDEGFSGATLVRPSLERLRDLAAQGQIETVLIYSPDRLSRKYAYQVLLMEEFGRHGVQVVFIKSPQATTPEESLLLQFQGMISEYERAQISERTRRGRKYCAKSGCVNALSGAPYGYRYVKKTDHSNAYYEIIEQEADIVKQVYRHYTEDNWSIGAVVRWLNREKIPTRKGKSPWERSQVWALLRNPAYKGMACFGKTERTERKKITRRLRQRGGFSPRCGANRARPREEWIGIPVPAVVNSDSFDLAQEQLLRNKHFSSRRTIEPTLLQGMLVCEQCAYSYYRSSTRTSKRKIYYYRCLGSDEWRYQGRRVCSNRPIRQDYLDEVVWKKVMELLENPELIQREMEQRIKDRQESSPTVRRKESLSNEIIRVQKGKDRLLDAYQEGLVPLSELRQRMPELRKRETTLQTEIETLETGESEEKKYQQLMGNMQDFTNGLKESAKSLNIKDRQRILRLVVKEIMVGPETLTIKHSIPTTGPQKSPISPSYRLCKGSGGAGVCEHRREVGAQSIYAAWRNQGGCAVEDVRDGAQHVQDIPVWLEYGVRDPAKPGEKMEKDGKKE